MSALWTEIHRWIKKRRTMDFCLFVILYIFTVSCSLTPRDIICQISLLGQSSKIHHKGLSYPHVFHNVTSNFLKSVHVCSQKREYKFTSKRIVSFEDHKARSGWVIPPYVGLVVSSTRRRPLQATPSPLGQTIVVKESEVYFEPILSSN